MQELSVTVTIYMDSNSFSVDGSFSADTFFTATRVATDLGGISADYPVNITKDPVDNPSAFITPSVITNKVYTIDDPELSIVFNSFYFNITECTDVTFTYTVLVNGSATFPSFIDYDSDLRTIWIISSDINHEGFYEIEVKGTIYDGTYDSTTFMLEIVYVDPTPITRDVIFQASKSLNYTKVRVLRWNSYFRFIISSIS